MRERSSTGALGRKSAVEKKHSQLVVNNQPIRGLDVSRLTLEDVIKNDGASQIASQIPSTALLCRDKKLLNPTFNVRADVGCNCSVSRRSHDRCQVPSCSVSGVEFDTPKSADSTLLHNSQVWLFTTGWLCFFSTADFLPRAPQTTRASAATAMADNRAPTTMGALKSPPRGNIVAQNPKMGVFRTNPDEKDQETIEIRSRPHHHPFSQRQRHVPRIPRKPHVKRATQQLNNTEKKSTNDGNATLTRDECVHLFTTLTAPIVEAMKLQTEALLAFNQMMLLAEQQESQAASIQQKQRDMSIEQMLQTFLTQCSDPTAEPTTDPTTDSTATQTADPIPAFEIRATDLVQ